MNTVGSAVGVYRYTGSAMRRSAVGSVNSKLVRVYYTTKDNVYVDASLDVGDVCRMERVEPTVTGQAYVYLWAHAGVPHGTVHITRQGVTVRQRTA